MATKFRCRLRRSRCGSSSGLVPAEHKCAVLGQCSLLCAGGGLRPPACPAVRGQAGRGQARCRAPGATTVPGDQPWQPAALTPPPWARVRSAGRPAARERSAQPGEPCSVLQRRLFRRRVANSRGRREHGQGRRTPRRSSRAPCLCGQPRAGCALLWCGLLSGWSCSAACHSQWQSRAEPPHVPAS